MPHLPTRRAALLGGLAGGAALLAAPGLARAQDGAWPSRPIRLIVPFAPGGSNDAIARPLAEALHARLGQPVVVENRAGAGSTLGSSFVAKAPADGHTLLIASSSFATSAAIQRTPYDPIEGFDSIARICTAPMLLVTAPNSPFRDVPALLAHARAHPNEVQYGTAGPGNIGHLATELLNMVAGVKTEAVPYAGIGPAQVDLVAGRLSFIITTMASVRGLVDSGRVPVIAYTGRQRAPYAPAIPTVQEQTGLDYAVEVFWGLLAPRGVPAPVVERLNREVNAALIDPGYARFLDVEGAVPQPELGAIPMPALPGLGHWLPPAPALGAHTAEVLAALGDT
jgi:tripartite-type tricarboxylate transporter receptor subunit TctC